MLSVAVPLHRVETRGTVTAGWIISRRDDLLWFQGSVVAGLALLVFFRFVQLPSQPGVLNPGLFGVFLWGVLFDATHVWATYARTYFAPDQASRARLPGVWSWGLLAVGPAIALVARACAAPVLFEFFLLFAYIWAYWHLVRQHYGFLALYRQRASEHNPKGMRLDGAILWTGCLYPFARFSLSGAYSQSGLPQLIPPALIGPSRVALDSVFALAVIVLLMIVFSRRLEPIQPGPRHLLLAIVIGFNLLVFATLDNLLAILATLTIFHNLQYHRIVWQYERGLGRAPSGGLGRYLAQGIMLGLVWYGARALGVAALYPGVWRNVLIGVGWGVAFHHYLLDGRIWHVRRSRSVASALEAAAIAR